MTEDTTSERRLFERLSSLRVIVIAASGLLVAGAAASAAVLRYATQDDVAKVVASAMARHQTEAAPLIAKLHENEQRLRGVEGDVRAMAVSIDWISGAVERLAQRHSITVDDPPPRLRTRERRLPIEQSPRQREHHP